MSIQSELLPTKLILPLIWLGLECLLIKCPVYAVQENNNKQTSSKQIGILSNDKACITKIHYDK